jgi:hypothetical protein
MDEDEGKPKAEEEEDDDDDDDDDDDFSASASTLSNHSVGSWSDMSAGYANLERKAHRTHINIWKDAAPCTHCFCQEKGEGRRRRKSRRRSYGGRSTWLGGELQAADLQHVFPLF